MTIRSQTTGETAVLSMTGTIARSDFSRLHDCLAGLLRERRNRIVLDFRHVDHISYRDASLFVREFELIRSHDGDVTVAGLSPYIRDILVFAGLSGVIEALALQPDTLKGLGPAGEPHAS